jgi:hypothetical protein
MKSAIRQQQSQKPFRNLMEAFAEFTAPADFRCALVDDVHFQRRRFSRLTPKELLEACGVEIGNLGDFCISQVPSDRVAFNTGDSGWSCTYTYRIPGKNRRTIRFRSEHGDGGLCDSCVGPYVYRRQSKKKNKA